MALHPGLTAAEKIAAITALLIDDAGEWIELKSCADAIMEISGIIEKPDRPITMNSAQIIEVRRGKESTVVYVRIPPELALPCGNCVCAYCLAHPTEVPKWDTLAVPVTKACDYAWTVHYPDPKGDRP